MTLSHKIWDFPNLTIQSQLFHVPGSYFDGGLTSGGARIMSPEPGGRAILELTTSLQVSEWETPFTSWLMSKINGEIFKVQLTKTPQLVSFEGETNSQQLSWDNSQRWNNNKGWADDGAYLETTSSALEGSVSISVDIGSFGEILKHGHVIGLNNTSHLIDDVAYEGSTATVTISPPLRNDISENESVQLRPYFLGTIANGTAIRNSYEASKVGAIQLNTIVFNEVILSV